MASGPTIPPKPWLHPENNSSVSLSSRGMEVGVPPGQEPPSPNQYRDVSPTNDERYRTWNRVSNTIAAQQRAASPAAASVTASAWSTGSSSQVSPRSSFRHEHEAQPVSRPLTPRLQHVNTSQRKIQQLTGYEVSTENLSLQQANTSSRKIQQLTGYEVSTEKIFPKKHLQVSEKVASTTASDSEGSVYSQPDTSAQSSEIQVQSPTVSLRAHTISRLQQNVAPSAEDIIMLQHILTEQQQRYEEALLNDMGSMVPKPLAIRSKRAKKSGPSILKSARDSFEWGISELTSPKAKKADKSARKTRFSMHSGNTTPEEMPPSPPPKSPRRRKNLNLKESFVVGDHPLKSPYPFLGKEEEIITSPSEGRFGSKISGAVKNLAAGGSRGSRTKKIVTSNIGNKGSKNSTPNTPVSKSSFVAKSTFVETIQKGNGQLQEMIEKTKKSVLRTADEKRRDELKKKIVVVGIGDQSPGSFL